MDCTLVLKANINLFLPKLLVVRLFTTATDEPGTGQELRKHGHCWGRPDHVAFMLFHYFVEETVECSEQSILGFTVGA